MKRNILNNKILILFSRIGGAFKVLAFGGVLIFYFLFSFSSVLAIGIGAEPSSLDLELKLGQSKEVKILVYNISQEAGIFQVSADELNEWVKIEPNNFRLEAGENKEIKINISAREKGRKATNLSVLATPLDRRDFSVGLGLKIPLRLNVEQEKSLFLASLLGIISQDKILITGILGIILIIGFFLIRYSKKRKKDIIPPKNLPIESDKFYGIK